MNRIIISPHESGILNLSEKLIRELDQLFSPHRPEKIRINLIDNRQEFDRLIGHRTPSWFAANTQGYTIFILKPGQSKKYHQAKFGIILKHELTHVYISRINQYPLRWLDEGLALNLAGQTKENVIPVKHYFFHTENLYQKVDYQTFYQNSGYIFSYHFVHFLVNHLGISAVIDLLHIKSSQKLANTLSGQINLNHDQLLCQIKKDLILV